ncbi:MAG: xanthine dehydrogenase family protein molybdopterin-binding subunit [Acidimicrobiia bacterium]
MALLGTGVPRREDDHFLRGAGTYIANLDLPGALHVVYVTSTMAHAELVRIDVDAARRAPGVVDVVTAADLDVGPVPTINPGYPDAMARPLLATGRVRFVGEAVAAIVAESVAAAEDAAELVEVDYEPLPAVVGIEGALADDAALLFPEVGTNVVLTAAGGDDEGDAALEACEVVVRDVFRNQRVAPCPLETRVAAATWDDEGRLVHRASCQGAHPVRAVIAATLGLTTEQIRVIAPDVGGSFGAKARPHPEEILLGWLSRRVGRPVVWNPDRGDDMTGLGHSRAQRQTVEIGGDRDGTIRAMRVLVDVDAGAYPVVGPIMASNTATMTPGPYRIASVTWSTRAVVSNATPVVAYRGAGRPEASALVERAVDLFAAELELDPVDVRRTNLLRADEFPFRSATGLLYDSGDYHRGLDELLAAVDLAALRAEQADRLAAGASRLLGLGVALFIDRTAGVPGSEYGAVELRPDGTLLVRTGSSPYGQGHHTAWAMLVADRTGLPLDRIEVVHGDTDVVPRGGVTGGSRSAQKAGSAVAEATDALVVEARSAAAALLEAAADDVVLDLATGRFHVAGAPGASTVSWDALAAEVHAGGGGRPGLSCETDFDGDGPTFPFGAYLAVVEVDRDTGEVTLDRIVTVDDAGTILNPVLALGQVHGGLGQGIGQALFEEFLYDGDGNPLTASFADYAFPSAADLPSFECRLIETPSPNNPLGFKGIAESGTIGAPPAIQSAVVDALSSFGVRHLDLPLTAERVWRAMQPHTPDR